MLLLHLEAFIWPQLLRWGTFCTGVRALKYSTRAPWNSALKYCKAASMDDWYLCMPLYLYTYVAGWLRQSSKCNMPEWCMYKCRHTYEHFIYECVMSHASRAHAEWYMNDYHHTYDHSIYERVMSHISRPRVSHKNESCAKHTNESWATHTNESRPAYEWVLWHVWINHTTCMTASLHTCEGLACHMWMSAVTRMNESWHIYKWVTSHIWMIRGSHPHVICQSDIWMMCGKWLI